MIRVSSAPKSRERIPKPGQRLERRNEATGPHSIARADLLQRAEAVRKTPVDFIRDPSFDSPALARELLREIESGEPAAARNRKAREAEPSRPGLFGEWGVVDLLTPEQEKYWFLRMNFCKFLAAQTMEALPQESPSAELLQRAERLLAESVRCRNHLAAANLRLVVSVAQTYVNEKQALTELVSDGNLSLLKAIEKFDASRGFRFSTYATWALRYNFARSLGADHKRRLRFVTGAEKSLEEVPAAAEGAVRPSPRAHAALGASIKRMMEQLDSRERTIVEARFGLGRASVELTLQQIAAQMGICKERVRQLQLRALDKLRLLAADERLEDLVEV